MQMLVNAFSFYFREKFVYVVNDGVPPFRFVVEFVMTWRTKQSNTSTESRMHYNRFPGSVVQSDTAAAADDDNDHVQNSSVVPTVVFYRTVSMLFLEPLN